MNYSTFDLNVMHALAGAASDADTLDEATTMYMRGKDRGAHLAEQAALEWCAMAPFIRKAAGWAHDAWMQVGTARISNPNAAADVVAFIAERQYRRHFPDGRAA